MQFLPPPCLRSMLVFGLVALIGLASAQAAEHPTVELPQGVEDWVIHETTGRVFASLFYENVVVEFDSKGKEVRRFETGKGPEDLILKHDLLVVGCQDAKSLDIFDLKTNQKKGSIQVPGSGLYGLFCSQADNNYVYCFSRTGSSWWDGDLVQLDLETKQVRHQVKTQQWGQWGPLHVAMSRDGCWIVLDARGNTSPSGADLMKVNEEDCTFQQVRDYHASFGIIVPGPLGHYWTFGPQLYTLDISKKLRQFSGDPVAIHPQKELAASKSKKGIELERFSDSVTIDTVQLSEPPKRTVDRDQNKRRAHKFDPTVAFDLKNELVFLGEETRGTWVSLRPYADQLKPMILIQAPSEVRVPLGEIARIPIKVTNPSDDTVLSITKGPTGAKLEGGELVWQSDASHIGFNEIQLELKSKKSGQTFDSVKINVEIATRKLDIGIMANTISLSPDQKTLLVYGPGKGQESRHPAHSGLDEVILVDVPTRKILAQRSYPQGIRFAAINDKYVFVFPKSGTLFYRLDRKLEGDERTFVEFEPDAVATIGNDMFVVNGRSMSVFQPEELKTIPGPWDSRENGSPGIKSVDNGRVEIYGQVFDPVTGKVVGMSRMSSLPQFAAARPTRTNFFGPRQSSVSRWGRTLVNNQLLNNMGNRIANLEAPSVLSHRWPMAIKVGQSKSTNTITTYMQLANMIDGRVEHSSTIDVTISQPYTQLNHFFGAGSRLIETDSEIIFLNNDQLIFAEIPVDIAKKMPMPTYFPPQPIRTVQVGEKFSATVQFAGTAEGTTFTLMTEDPAITIDSKTGEVTVDTQAFWDGLINATNTGIRPSARPASFASTSLPDFADNAKAFQTVTGKELAPDQLAIHLSITVSLQDAERQSDSTTLDVLLVGPRKAADEAKAKAQEAAKAQMAQARQVVPQRPTGIAEQVRAARERSEKARQDAAAGGNANLEQRVQALETKLNRMEAILDSILSKLEKEEK